MGGLPIESDGSQHVHVTASGYSSVERVDYIAVRGGDGRSHKVPVHWHEYHDVRRASNMIVTEKAPASVGEPNSDSDNEEATLRKVFEQRGVEYQNAILRRSTVSALLPS